MAVIFRYAGSTAGGAHHQPATVPLMTNRLGIIRSVAIATFSAGICCIALRQTGGSSYFFIVTMPQMVGVIGFVIQTTILAVYGRIANIFTGGSGYLLLQPMTFSVLQNRSAFAAKLRLGAGCRLSCRMSGGAGSFQTHCVALCVSTVIFSNPRSIAGSVHLFRAVVPNVVGHFTIIAHIAVPAFAAGVGCISLTVAAGRCCLLAVIMPQSARIIAFVALVTVNAGIGGKAHFGTGWSGSFLPIAVPGGLRQNCAAYHAGLRI